MTSCKYKVIVVGEIKPKKHTKDTEKKKKTQK